MNEEGNPLGLNYTPTIGDAVQGIQDYGRTVINFWGGVVRTVPQALTSYRESIREEAAKPSTFATSTSINPIKELGSLSEDYAASEAKAMESVASGLESVGVPTPLAGAAAGIAGAFLPGPTDVNLAMKGGSALLGLTVQNPKFLAKGIKQGVGQSQLYKAGVEKLRRLESDGIIKRKMYQEQFDTGVINEKQLQSRLSKLKKREDANYSTLGTVDDPDIFEVKSQVQRDPIDPTLPAHQHHAAAKAMTTPWVKKALKLGDDDDVVAFFEFHRMLTGSGMGNVKSGMIDLPGFAHIPRDARTPSEVPMAVHSFMKKSGADIEMLTPRVEKIVGDPKNMDELMEKYSTFAAEYLIPQKELALKRLNQVLTQHRQTLTPKQSKVFDDLVSKLNKAGT